jgi:selenocysteine lyase/cysteine desulfurase
VTRFDEPPAGLDVDAVRRQIPALEGCVYTNTAGFGPLPRPVWEDLRRREEEIFHRGLDVVAHDPEWWAEADSWRARVAGHFGAQPDEIAFGRALGEGLNMVLSGLDWRPGDELIITDQEHPTGMFPALALAARWGARVRTLRAAGSDEENLARFQDLLSPRTRLVAVSAVTTEVGVRLPAARICQIAAEREVPVYLDLAQAAGQFPLDLARVGCAFAAASGSKWLLGPLGTAFFYFRRDWIDRLHVAWTGSHTGRLDYDAGRYEFAAGARRFEFGGRHLPLVGAMVTAVDWVAAFGWEAVEARAAMLASRLKAALARLPGVALLTPAPPPLSTGIVTFSLAEHQPGEVVGALRERWRIRSRPTMFNGVRISLAFFNTEEEVDLIAAAVEAIRTGSPPRTQRTRRGGR